MRISVNNTLLASLFISCFISCTPTEDNHKNTPRTEVVETGDDSSVRPDNDKD